MNSCPELVIGIDRLPPEGKSVTGELPMSALDVPEDDRISCPQPLAFDLSVAPVQGKVLVRGRLSTVLRCRCDRCLTYYSLPLATEDVCHLFEVEHQKFVDLTGDVREDILIVFPLGCVCRPECRGLCPSCGHNLNSGLCSCAASAPRPDVWQALDGLELTRRRRR
jgi:uncharacterized protein